MKWINEKLKGWRGILLSWLGVLLTFAESAFQVASGLIADGNPIVAHGGWKSAVVVAVLITVKNLVTDVGKK
jgi:hypothetical protein